MGTQWRGMGLSLMRLDSFRESILLSDEALKPLGVKVSDLLLSTDEHTFDDIVHAFVSLTAIQVCHLCGTRALGHSTPESRSPGPDWGVGRALNRYLGRSRVFSEDPERGLVCLVCSALL